MEKAESTFHRQVLVFSHSYYYECESESCSVVSNSRNSMDCSLPGSSVRGILQATVLAWVAILFSRGSSQPKDWTWVSCTAGRFLTIWATRACWATVHGVTESDSNERPAAAAAKSLQSCPTLCDPIDGSPPGSPVPGILQARTLKWVAISFSNAWKWKVKVKLLSHVWLLATPWTAAHQAPPTMGFSRQEYWSGVPLPSPLACSVHLK